MCIASTNTQINFVVALNSEAQPLVEHFNLQANKQAGRQRVYRSDGINLVVSGIGQAASAAAVGYLSGLTQRRNQMWINVGVAGHQRAKLGEYFLVDKIIDESTNRVHFPSLSFRSSVPSALLRTVPTPQTNYPDNALYDMEGSAFFEAASMFTSVELITLFKTVSDNRSNSIEKITKQLLRELISQSIPAIVTLVEKMRTLAAQLRAHDDSFSRQWLAQNHTSATHELQFIELQRRVSCLAPDIDIREILSGCRNTAEAIDSLKSILSRTRLHIL